jgi:sialic acid synthase
MKLMNKRIKLKEGRFIGEGEVPYVIAEIGINHNGDFELAKKMIRVAATTGVDAIKLQKRTVAEMYTKSFLDQPYLKSYAYGKTYGDHKRFLEFSDESFFELKDLATQLGLDFIVSGFDYTSFEFIDKELNVDMHKIASPFVTHYPMLKQVANYGKPLILSTGMHSFEEVKNAIAFIKQFNDQIILFQATTLYPCPDELVNLNVMKTYRDQMEVLVGYSSHDKGVVIPAASVAVGACVIEKHYTLDRTMIGPDHSASVEKEGLEKIVKYANSVFLGLGNSSKEAQSVEAEARIKYGVSIVSKNEMARGHIIQEEDITVKCPGGGISPVNFWNILGKKVAFDIKADEIIYEKDVE